MKRQRPPEVWRIPHCITNAKYLSSSKKRHRVFAETDSYWCYVFESEPVRAQADTHIGALARRRHAMTLLSPDTSHNHAPASRPDPDRTQKSRPQRSRLKPFRSATGGTTVRREALHRRNTRASHPGMQPASTQVQLPRHGDRNLVQRTQLPHPIREISSVASPISHGAHACAQPARPATKPSTKVDALLPMDLAAMRRVMIAAPDQSPTASPDLPDAPENRPPCPGQREHVTQGHWPAFQSQLIEKTASLNAQFIMLTREFCVSPFQIPHRQNVSRIFGESGISRFRERPQFLRMVLGCNTCAFSLARQY